MTKLHGEQSIKSLSRAGLNAANFFQAEMAGVIVPVLGVFLKEAHWRYDTIGLATGAAGLGTLVMQALAGALTDKISARRLLFAVVSILTGLCFAAIPLLPNTRWWVAGLLFAAGAVQSFFSPLLGALALALVGHELLNCTAGVNQVWNHAGNITAALAGMVLVQTMGVTSVFYAVGVSSLLAAGSVLLIRRKDLDEHLATGLTPDEDTPVAWKDLLCDRTLLLFFISIFLFHLANAPILPAVALYVKQLGGADELMTATVLTAQIVMVPAALFAGRYGDRWGRKAVLMVAFWVLPIRILSYALVSDPKAVVLLQGLDGVGAGIYGVAVIALAADLTRGKGRFNTLAGLFATALAIGGVTGNLLSGVLLQHLGFRSTFYAFSAIATICAVVFTVFIPEPKPAETARPEGEGVLVA